MAARKIWTPEQDQWLRDNMPKGASGFVDLMRSGAARFGRTECAVRNRMDLIRGLREADTARADKDPARPRWDRACLKCGRHFKPDSPYIRLCSQCKTLPCFHTMQWEGSPGGRLRRTKAPSALRNGADLQRSETTKLEADR